MDTQSKPDKLAACRRCGTCCQKGGPALHCEDRGLVEAGTIPLKVLYTLRPGEWVRDNVRGGLCQATDDVIKIKGQPDSTRCRFLNEVDHNRCVIYEYRPTECRVLKCWVPGPLERMYNTERLTRKDLLSQTDKMWELVADHENQCAYRHLDRYREDLMRERHTSAAVRGVLEMIRYDQQLRRVMAEKTQLNTEIMDFLFGRPLLQSLAAFEIRLVQVAGEPHLEYRGKQYSGLLGP